MNWILLFVAWGLFTGIDDASSADRPWLYGLVMVMVAGAAFIHGMRHLGDRGKPDA